MGVTLTYQAIPPDSIFYSRSQHDRTFRALVNFVFPHGCGIFSFFQNGLEFNEVMEDAIDSHPDLFCGTELEISMAIGEFRYVLGITCRDYPEITFTDGSLEKSFVEVRMDFI